MAQFEFSEQINGKVRCEDNQLQEINDVMEKFPIIKQAVLLAVLAKQGYMAQKEYARDIYGHDILRVASLIERVNPRFPTDSFSPATLHALLTTVNVDVEEIDILSKALPDYNGSKSIRISASLSGNCLITFTNAMKHCGVYYEISFTGKQGLCYPITVDLISYADMDDLKNHQEWDGLCGCPQRIQKWICPHCQKECGLIDSFSYNSDDMIQCYDCEKFTKFDEIEFDYSNDDCDCEASVACSDSLVIEEDFNSERVCAWIEENLFGQ